jgi:predicted PurR-regulated permease PerM
MQQWSSLHSTGAEEDTMTAPARRPRDGTPVDVGWSSLLLVAALLGGSVVLLDLARAVDDTVVHLVLAVVLALALDRVVGLVERWTALPRVWAVVAVVTAAVAAVAGVVAVLAPAVVAQGERLRDDGPAVLDDLVRLPVVGRSLQENDVPAQAQRWLETAPERLTRLDELLFTAQVAALQAVGVLETLLLLALLLAEGPSLVRSGRRLLPPAWQPTARRLGTTVYVVVGRYAVGSVLLAVLAGLAAFVIGLALDVPLAAVAALWAFLWNFVPQLGGVVGGAALVLLALTVGPGSAAVALTAWLVYTQLENRLVQPVVVGRAVQLTPLTTMVVALVGVAVAGLLGAVLAVPLVAAVKAARLELRSGASRCARSSQ